MTDQLSRRSLLAAAALAPVGVALTGCGTDESAAAASSRGQQTRAGNNDDVRHELRDLEESRAVRIGAFAIDTANNATLGHRADERFPLCSTFKLLAAAAVLHKNSQSDSDLLRQIAHYDKSDVVEHSPVTKTHVDDGMPLADVCKAALTKSDNTAANLLLERIGGPDGVTDYARSLHDRVTRLDRREVELNRWKPGQKRDTTTPEAIGHDLLRLAHSDALPDGGRKQLNEWLRGNTTGNDAIRAGLPAEWTVGDKTGGGIGYGTTNDIAIAHPPDGDPIVLAIYTNHEDENTEPDNSMIAKTATILARGLGRID